jgi:DNA-directed RNA polymerase sigma subunit (sigma70/sigma32)
MENLYKRIDNEEALLEDNENFLSLEELAEEELPMEENEIFPEADREFSDKILNSYFRQIYRSDRNLDMAKKYYGIGQESKSLTKLAEEYSLSPQRIQKIVSIPCQRWKSDTIKILNSIKSRISNFE